MSGKLLQDGAAGTEELVDFQTHKNQVHQLRLVRIVGTCRFIVRVIDTDRVDECVRAFIEQGEAEAWAVMYRLVRAENPAEGAL